MVPGGLAVSLDEYRESLLIGSFSEVHALRMEIQDLKNKLKAAQEDFKKLTMENSKLVKAASGKGVTAGRDVAMRDIVHVNIHLNAYTNPSLPENADKLFRESIRKISKSVPDLVEKLHLNPDIPENLNIKISNLRSKTVKVFDGTDWRTMSDDALLERLVTDNEQRLEEFAEEHTSNQRFIDQYNEIKEREGQEKFMKDVKEDVRRVLYDKNHLVKVKS